MSINVAEFNSDIKVRTRIKKPFTCLQKGSKWIILTTAKYSLESIKSVMNLSNWKIMIVEDVDTDENWNKNKMTLQAKHPNVLFLTLEQQFEIDFDVIDVMSTGIYARRHIGYLSAIKCGAKFIYEANDDILDVDELKRIGKTICLQGVQKVSCVYIQFSHPYLLLQYSFLDAFFASIYKLGMEKFWHGNDYSPYAYFIAYVHLFL